MPWPAVPRMVDLWDVAIQKLGFLANPSFTLRSPSAVRKSASDDRFTADARLRVNPLPAGSPPFADANQMDDHKSIIMMLALWALVGVITLICWLRDLRQRRLAIRWATWRLVDPADKCDGPESVQHGLRDADMDLAALRLSSEDWRKFPSTDELKTYVDVLTGDAPRQSNARLLALVLAILVGVIGTLVILGVWLSPTPEQIQAARNGQGKQGWQQSTPVGEPSLLGQYGVESGEE